MQSADHVIADRLAEASATLVQSTMDPEVRTATKPEFGHFQSNLPLRLGRALGVAPARAAADVLAVLDVSDICLPPEIAGPGFLNFRLSPQYLADYLTRIADDPRLGVPQAVKPERIVLDYSGPNVAKVMHVAHLRSTVIGDALSRLLEFAGHQVIRQNHIGDWGTPFGMLIEQLRDEHTTTTDLAALSALYRRARARFDTEPEFADRARSRVVALQRGDERTRADWRRLVETSLDGFDDMYRHLGVALTKADAVGESAYNDDLPVLAAELDRLGLLTESAGAGCVFPPGFRGRDGRPLPVIIRKSDGGFGYSATDLAAIRHRVGTLDADRLIYVVGAPQALHFDQVFAVARQAGWLPAEVRAEHVTFGTVLDETGKPIKSRTGEAVPLQSLLQTAESAAADLLAQRSTGDVAELAAMIGVGAVKYADLSAGRARDYVFAVDRLVALDGNTGPYLQYAHARLCSLLRRAGEAAAESPATSAAALDDPAEVRLAFVLTRFPAAVTDTLETLEPHRLCGYLYQLATAISTFYERCPVLADTVPDTVRNQRLALCTSAERTLKRGLDFLAIPAPGTM